MAWCADHGRPHSWLLGRVPGPGEPEWLQSDRDKLHALIEQRERLCGRCGTEASEWGEWVRDETGELKFRPFLEPPYVAKTRICHGCRTLDERLADVPPKRQSHTKAELVRPAT